MNPMLQILNKSTKTNAPMSNNLVEMLQQFNQFKAMRRGRDPQQMINELIRQGKMTPEQLEQLKKQAQALSGILR